MLAAALPYDMGWLDCLQEELGPRVGEAQGMAAAGPSSRPPAPVAAPLGSDERERAAALDRRPRPLGLGPKAGTRERSYTADRYPISSATHVGDIFDAELHFLVAAAEGAC